MAFRFIFPPRRFLRLLLSALFFASGLTYAVRALGADFEFFLASRISDTPEQALYHLRRARVLFPYDHNVRASTAYFYTAFRFYDQRKEAIQVIEQELEINPFAVDLLVALAAYKFADGNRAGAEQAIAKVKKLRPDTIVEEP